jgi:putative two-component system response regulator
MTAASEAGGFADATATAPVAERHRILVVDDEPAIRAVIARVLHESGHDWASAGTVADALPMLTASSYSLVLCDMTMPGGSGLELVRQLQAGFPDTPVVMVTGIDDPDIARAARELGAYGYVLKPFSATVLRIAVENALHRRRLEIDNRRHREHLAELVADRTIELRRSREETIRRLALAVALRDGETGEHIERMSLICAKVAEALGLPDARCELIRLASPLHDVGKIGIPDRILRSPESLSPEDWDLIRQHPEIGYQMLSGSGEELLDLAACIALTHHERLDGSGYPRRLRGDEIPIEGQIVSVADAYDVLTSGRVYQPAMSVAEAAEVLRRGRGTLFDAVVLDALLRTVGEETSPGRRKGSEALAAQ